MLPYEKTYLVTTARLETKELAVLELLDESSIPPNTVKTIVARIALQDYLGLAVTLGDKVKVTITGQFEEPKKP